MAKANRKTLQEALVDALQGAAPVAPATVVPAPVAPALTGAQPFQHMVYDGVNMIDAKLAPTVKASDVAAAGASMKNLALNFLAETLDASVQNPEADCWKNRSIKDQKTAFFKLLNVKNNGGKRGAQIVLEAWNADAVSRKSDPKKRITPVSLSGLAKLFKTERVGGGVSPYTTIKAAMAKLKADILTIAESNLKPSVRLAKIAEMCQPEAEKAE